MKEVTLRKREPALEFSLSGEIDSGNSDEFFEEVRALYAQSPRDVIFECSALDFIDSTTLGTFVKILKHVREDGFRLRLKGLQPRLKKLFLICALDTIMEIEE